MTVEPPEVLTTLLASLADRPLAQGAVIALGTFVLEDAATLACGLLISAGLLSGLTAYAGLSVGIALGDVGLHAIGRLGARLLGRRGRPAPALVARGAELLRRHALVALVVARCVPGLRLPTYLAAGAAGVPLRLFAAVIVPLSLAWTAVLLLASVGLGVVALPEEATAATIVGGGIVVLGVAGQVVISRRVRAWQSAAAAAPRTRSPFEFWPPWLFYMPVALQWLRLSVRHRHPLLPAVANPSIPTGGLIGESKSAILDLVPPSHRALVAPWCVVAAPQGDEAELQEALARARDAMEAGDLSYPVVAKPDVGQRGDGVRPVANDGELRDYLGAFPAGERAILQRLVGQGEAGVLWWRRPGANAGEIFSITLKEWPSVTGDGRRTLRQLILDDRRARLVKRVYFERHADRLDEVLAEGETLRLVFTGNHCKGAVFRDGTALATADLARTFDDLGSAIPGLHFARFDVRFDDLDAFLRGEDLQVIEINGSGAEATHVWDPDMSLARAYRTLFRQVEILFELGAEQRRRGHRPPTLRQVGAEVLGYRRRARRYPVAW